MDLVTRHTHTHFSHYSFFAKNTPNDILQFTATSAHNTIALEITLELSFVNHWRILSTVFFSISHKKFFFIFKNRKSNFPKKKKTIYLLLDVKNFTIIFPFFCSIARELVVNPRLIGPRAKMGKKAHLHARFAIFNCPSI